MTDTNPTPNSNVTVTVPDSQWRGLTLEQLRMRRAKALLRREVGKVKIDTVIGNLRTRVSDNGIRGLMFSNKAIGNLKIADYAFLGWKIAQIFFKVRRRKK